MRKNNLFSRLVCGDSQLNLFSVSGSTNLNNINPLFFTELVKQLNSGQSKRGTARLIDLKSFINSTSSNSTTSPNSNSTTSTSTSTSTSTLPPVIDILKALNALNSIPSSFCPVDTSLPNDAAGQLYADSTVQRCFCQTILTLIGGLSQTTATILGQLSPMLLGKILYSPNTVAYQKLIKQMNATFSNIDQIAKTLANLGTLGSTIVQSVNASQISTLLNFLLTQLDPTLGNVDLQTLLSQIDDYSTVSTFVSNSMYCVELNKFVGFSTEDEAVALGIKLIQEEYFYAVVAFQNAAPNDYQLPDLVKYKIRMNSSQTHDTRYTQDQSYSYGASLCLGCNSYFLYGFIYIQDMLERAIVEFKTNQTQDFGIIAQMTPYPCYINDKFVTAISRTLPLFIVLAWIYTVSMMVKDIVYEKEKRLKEFMRVMGLTNATHWTAWFITSFIAMYLVSFLLCLILKFGKITTFTDLGVLMAFFCCFTIATITQCFLISTFFNKANIAAVNLI